MSDTVIAQGNPESDAGATMSRILLTCGVISSVLYVAGEVLASNMWGAYSYVNQAVSELAAVGAPTRPLMLGLFTVYNLLVIAFTAGVWKAAGDKRSLRVVAIMLAVYAVVGEVTQVFSPMNPRGSAVAANDVGHIVLTTVEVLSIVLFIGFGSVTRGKGFRLYSLVTIMALVAGGVLTGMLSTHMTALADSTPWAGITERVNIYATMLWVLVFAETLLRFRAGDTAVRPTAASASGRPLAS